MRSVVLVALACLAACGSGNPANRLIVSSDAGVDAPAEAAASGGGTPGADAGSPYLGGPCIDDGQCDDVIACTYDSCDTAIGRCLNVPDDTQCDDGIYCDGREQCVPGHGCEPGPVVTCSEGNACSIAQCVEATRSCVYTPRDVDQDGDPDGHCPGGHDCDDLDPNVSSLHVEVCGNGVDDNCNGQIDESPCVAPQGETCDAPVAISGPGTYELSTIGNGMTLSTSCSVTTPSAGQTVVAAITVPAGAGAASDLEVWATSGVEVAVALEAVCGQPSTELGCGSGKGATSVRTRAYGVSPGIYYAVVTTQSQAPVELKVVLLPPTPPATNVDCATATPIAAATPTTVSIVDLPTQLPSACATPAGELTYALTITQPQDVRIYASTVEGSGSPVIGLRDPTCVGAADELSCQGSASLPVYWRSLQPGVYVVTVGATAPIDVSVQVVLSPPTQSPADQTCVSPPGLGQPGIAPEARVAFDLASHEDAIKDGCQAGGSDAAYDLALLAASDVLLIERLPLTDPGAVSLDLPSCMVPIACATGATPVRVGTRNVGPGDYRAVVTDQLGLEGTLDALVRPTVAPTIVAAGAADSCASAPVDVSSGGFFTGDTSTASADFDNPCDAPTSPPGGAADQILSLTLPRPQRVVLDMEGSSYTTIVDVRMGSSCPGTPVANACYVGFGAQKSFLDLELAAGQYWVIIDGYGGQAGAWNLDVRVLDP
jgi:Putative metal-binding motif